MGEARRRRLEREAYLNLPLYLRQPPLPRLACPCLRPNWEPIDVMEALRHSGCATR